MKIDMHVHSKHSHRPSQWILQKINCPESFTEPLMIYQLALKKGMTHVTITDHNKISGVLEIAHLPDVFVSEEITTYFPEDNCKVHVLAYCISESQHADIQHLRNNIYELVAYLRMENIFHAVAHPLYSVNDRLLVTHFEKMLVLFNVFEKNGARSAELNECLEAIVNHLSPEDIQFLADKHDLSPRGKTPWVKRLIGGSDDHSSLNIARSYTKVDNTRSIDEFTAGINDGYAVVCSEKAIPQTLAHNLYGIAYQFYNQKFNLNRRLDGDLLLTFLNKTLNNELENGSRFPKLTFINRYFNRSGKVNKIPESLKGVLHKEILDFILKDQKTLNLLKGHKDDEKHLEAHWFDVVNRVSNNATHHLGNTILDHFLNANIFKIFQSIGHIGGLYLLLSPYIIAFKQFAQDKITKTRLIHQLPEIAKKAGLSHGPLRIAHFTDTFDDVNGVALTLKQQVQEAQKHHLDYTLMICDNKGDITQNGIKAFSPVGSYSLPEYPEIMINYPPILEMLDYCYRENISHIISATPGPMGIAAWIIAKALNVTFSGTYHTAIPQYVQLLTGDDVMAELSWKYIIWYYDQMDRIQVPSKATKDELIEKGIQSERIDLINRGINIERFHPGLKNGFLRNRFSIPEKAVKLLYVGRVSKEKNLDLLADVFISLYSRYRQRIHLIITGDGPYLDAMKGRLKDFPCTFPGYLKGNDLACVYASSDIFVFPSTTDTFGNVVLEAQASGIPVVVSNEGGPCENVIPGETGFVSANHHDGFYQHIQKLIDDPAKRRKMGLSARTYMEERSFGRAFMETWKQLEQSTFSLPRAQKGMLRAI